MSSPVDSCPKCHLPIPAGSPSSQCPRCLMGLGLGFTEEAPTGVALAEAGREFAEAGSDPPSLVETRTRIGNYLLLGEIARGGMGIVYRARQVGLERVVALKMILAGRFATREQAERFRAEASAAARLQHPNIVRIHETGEREGCPYFSMDYVEGGDLTAAVQRGPMEARRAARLVRSLAEAIEYAHGQGILHRDLKPSNILLDAAGRPCITDFGLARSMDRGEGLTLTGELIGSPNFMPPEQVDARPMAGGPTNDVYGLGGILFHLLTGRAPFVGASVVETLDRVRHEEAISPRWLNGGVPEDLATICRKCLRKEPRQRYATARELGEDLERFLEGRPIRARPLGALARTWRWAWRNPVAAGLLFLTLFLSILVAAGSLASAARIRRAQRDLAANLYAGDMKLTQLALSAGRLGRARELLALHTAAEDGVARGFEWGLYHRWARGEEESRFQAYTNPVSGIAFVPGTNLLVTAEMGPLIHLREFPTFKPVAEARLPRGEAFTLSVSSDARWLAVGTFFGQEAHVYELPALRPVATIPGRWSGAWFAPDKPVLALIEGDGITGGNPGKLELWDPVSRRTLAGWPEAGSTFVWSRDGRTIFVGGWKHQMAARDASNGAVRWRVSDLGDVVAMDTSDEAGVVISSDWDGEVALWETVTGRRLGRLVGHRLRTWQIAISPDHRWVATANSDRTVKLWNLRTTALQRTFLGHEDEVWRIAFAPDGTRVISGDRTGLLMTWVLPGDSPTRGSDAFDVLFGPPAWSPDSSQVAFGIGKHEVGLIDARTGRIARRLPDAEVAVRFNPDGRGLDVLTRRGVETDPLDGSPRIPRGRPGTIREVDERERVACSRDGRQFARVRWGGELEVWDMDTTERRVTLKPELPGDVRPSFSPDGQTLALANMQAPFLEIFDRGLTRRRLFRTHRLGTGTVAFSPDGRWIASAGMDDTARVWELATGRPLAVLTDHTEGASGLCFSPDSLTLVVLSGGRWLRLWSLPTFRELGEMETEHYKTFVSFAPDGNTLMAWNPYAPQPSVQVWRGGTNR